ncbi:hypothetical protein CSUB_C0940 [Candidatus Caldarchaeum subterraneum]|uniref:Uncharacterized protein n=1 Tax=Caldiarchaeum subterraneum TaxID=311458 RepID=E6N6S1_CALS0|nr:hypothetical protein HGMM_F17C01C18 [Candidatus Caldarchaeum subterraneum]BAJ50794.1 hypothetical protein CSUB_C0940 [Candidatus Caldarchaeum subterraneum]
MFPDILALAIGQVGGVGNQIAALVREIILQIFQIATPVIHVISIGMIGLGLMLVALKQEYLGYRMVSAGIVGLVMIHLVIPYALGYI